MNLRDGFGNLREMGFRTSRALHHLLPRRSISAFGPEHDQIGAILVINLDRQPARWRHTQNELDRFKTSEGKSLGSITHRVPAVDARDGRETAPTADVDPIYLMRDQLFVQPDPRLEECFGGSEKIRMTRQEIAVARSHIEAWKRIARGPYEHALVLEDDAYFVNGAAALITRGWRAVLQKRKHGKGMELLYLSYLDAGGTGQRADVSADLFRPVRGFWYLSGYVLSRGGAESLLRSMPVVGPVDLWMNHRFAELNVFALSRSALLQRPHGGSDNAYSILPYLARSGAVDAGPNPIDSSITRRGLVLAWNAVGPLDAMGMALSTLGYRVRTFPKNVRPLEIDEIIGAERSAFDAYVDAKFDGCSLRELLRRRPDAKFIIDTVNQSDAHSPDKELDAIRGWLPPDKTVVLPTAEQNENRWEPLCDLLNLPVPNYAFPRGTPHEIGLFQMDDTQHERQPETTPMQMFDESPWVKSQAAPWRPRRHLTDTNVQAARTAILCADLSSPSPSLRALTETFPGNMATFERTGLKHGPDGTTFILQKSTGSVRPLSSGALASVSCFAYGRFEAEIRAAHGPGLITGFFLHRELPRQEIDIELLGDSHQMLVNVYFNPGDEGTAMAYGYRGTPHLINLGFNASAGFHTYAIEWTPRCIRWFVDGRVVHERSNWDPTPIPHLPMRLYANLWSPRSIELAGQLREDTLPALSTFKRIAVHGW